MIVQRISLHLVLLLGAIATTSLAFASPESLAIVVEEHRFTWRAGRSPYEVVSTIPRGWNDPGEYTELAIRIPDGKQLVLTELTGMPQEDVSTGKPNLLNSRYLLLTPGAPLDKDPFLLLTEYAFASSPGYVSVLALSDNGFPEFAFREKLHVEKLVDYNGDGRLDILIRGGAGEPWDGGESYDPYLVYTQARIDGHLKFKINENLSRRWSSENRYPWAGSSYSAGYLVTKNSVGATIRKVERKDESTIRNPIDRLISYHIDHTRPDHIRHALIDNYDNLVQLKKLNKGDLNIVKNAVFARRGYIFRRKDLQEYFDKQVWYKKQPNLSAGDAVEADGVDKATLAILDLFGGTTESKVIDKLESMLQIEARTDSAWKASNVTPIPSAQRIRPTSLGDVQIGDEFDRTVLEQRFGKIILEYQAMHQVGQFGGRNKGYTANLYLFEGIGIRTQNDGHGERIYAIHTNSASYKTGDGVAVGTKMSAAQETIPWIWVENKETGMLFYESCNDYSMLFERGLVGSILLRSCDRLSP